MSSIADYFKSREDPHKAYFDSLEIPAFLASISALDRYFGLPCGAYLNTVTGASLVEVARCFDELEFPGLPGLDAAARVRGIETPSGRAGTVSGECDEPEILLLVTCQLEEGRLKIPQPETGGPFGAFTYSPSVRRFYDPAGIYPVLRGKEPLTPGLLGLEAASSWEPWLDAAVLVSRYSLKLTAPAPAPASAATSPEADSPSPPGSAAGAWNTENQASDEAATARALGELFRQTRANVFPPVDPFRQREVLTRILEGRRPQKGLELLRRCGFIEAHWPELHNMREVRQGKEFHPEGDVWDHSLATFSYRKNADPIISLALLLHDSGKPEAEEFEGNKFHRHAQLGGRMANRFLRRLGFDQEIIDTVNYLVVNHMVPGITRTLPAFRVQEVISSPLYPLLLEVHRCDLSSTFRGPEGYYEACKVYRRYLKHQRNPFRDSGGRKRLRMYVD